MGVPHVPEAVAFGNVGLGFPSKRLELRDCLVLHLLHGGAPIFVRISSVRPFPCDVRIASGLHRRVPAVMNGRGAVGYHEEARIVFLRQILNVRAKLPCRVEILARLIEDIIKTLRIWAHPDHITGGPALLHGLPAAGTLQWALQRHLVMVLKVIGDLEAVLCVQLLGHPVFTHYVQPLSAVFIHDHVHYLGRKTVATMGRRNLQTTDTFQSIVSVIDADGTDDLVRLRIDEAHGLCLGIARRHRRHHVHILDSLLDLIGVQIQLHERSKIQRLLVLEVWIIGYDLISIVNHGG